MNAPRPDSTAVRTALWRALHLERDAPPHVVNDSLALALLDPEPGWKERPDMRYTLRLQASILARSRFVEELILSAPGLGIQQVLLLASGLDTFAERHPELSGRLRMYEVDQADTLQWKLKRLQTLKIPVPQYLKLVAADLRRPDFLNRLRESGWDPSRPSLVACAGLTLYLRKAVLATLLSSLSRLAAGSLLAVAFYLPRNLLDPEDQGVQDMAEAGARASGTPFESFFSHRQIRKLALDAGLKPRELLSTQQLAHRYFSERSDGLYPASGEVFLLAEPAQVPLNSKKGGTCGAP